MVPGIMCQDRVSQDVLLYEQRVVENKMILNELETTALRLLAERHVGKDLNCSISRADGEGLIRFKDIALTCPVRTDIMIIHIYERPHCLVITDIDHSDFSRQF